MLIWLLRVLLPSLIPLVELRVVVDGRGEDEPRVESGSPALGESVDLWVCVVWVVAVVTISAPRKVSRQRESEERGSQGASRRWIEPGGSGTWDDSSGLGHIMKGEEGYAPTMTVPAGCCPA